MDFEEVIQKRSSTRMFSDKKLEQEKLDKILEAGRIAPTAKNLQPVKIFAIQTEEGLAKVDKATPCRYGAPTVLLVCGDQNQAFQNGNHSTFETDSCIIATHMLLEATNIGVDDIWIDWFDREITKKEFDLPANLVPVCMIPLGYKAENCPENPSHKIRKPIEELVEYK